ncbi:MAG: hypothetical protein VYE73_19190, partial [Acidobacteriota bacterium]|nr:hypothetical protein [Acidobacteriota bacterium]
MKPRTLGALVGLVALLAGFVWFFERDLPSTARGEELARRVLAFEPAEVNRVHIEGPSGGVALLRTDGGWRLGEPLDDPADAQAVADLLEELSALESERSLDQWDPRAAGLD